jgi:hypothetical protein
MIKLHRQFKKMEMLADFPAVEDGEMLNRKFCSIKLNIVFLTKLAQFLSSELRARWQCE